MPFADFGRYNLRPLDERYWDVYKGSQTYSRAREDSVRGQDSFGHPRLVLRTDRFTPPSPARIRIRGRGFPNLIASVASDLDGPGATTNYEGISPVVAPELIKYAAALVLNESLPRSAQKANSAFLSSEEKRWERTYTTRMSSTGRRVRDY